MQATPEPVRSRSSPLWTIVAVVAVTFVLGLAVLGRLTEPAEPTPTVAPPPVAAASRSPASSQRTPDPGATDAGTPSRGNRLPPINDPRVAAAIPIGLYPIALAVGEGGVWIADTVRNTIVRVDPITYQVVATIKVAANPRSITIGAGSIWVASYAGDIVTRIDPRSNTVVARIAVPGGPTEVTFGDGTIWVASVLGSRVSAIDPASNAVRATYALGDRPRGVAVLDHELWVADAGSGAVLRIDPMTGVVRNTYRGLGADRVVSGVGALWVIDRSTGGLWRIDPPSGRTTIVRRDGVEAIGFLGPTPWLASLGGANVQPLISADGAVGDPIRAAGNGSLSAIVGEGETLWVTDLANGSVVRVTPGDGTAGTPAPDS